MTTRKTSLPKPRLITRTQAAFLMACHPRTLARYEKTVDQATGRPKLTAVKLNSRRTCYHLAEVESIIAGAEVTPAADPSNN